MRKGNDTFFYHYNAHGDVIALTNQQGEIVARYEYDAWGKPIKTEEDSVVADNPFRYAGYQYDKETGLYYLIARYYHPEHGVFLSLDPDPGDDDDILTQNGYTYANNNPVMLVDPDGHWVWFAVNAGFAAYEGYKAYKSGKGWKGIVAAAIGGSKIKAAKKAKTAVIYLRTNKKTGKQYVGRAKNWKRYQERQKEHARKNKQEYSYKVLLRTKPGRQARRYEQKFINRYGGPGKLENKRNEISKKKWKKYNI